ncbi:PREDICTED: melanoma-associated antigen B5-like [Chinchilla lanigera]|uniref:melanoma-associated antigen B5-like n=1 Tax=Chinchilla lanigera TaxID=34839 RepID=UPI000697CCF1|nr:PREDICTED: melanoma-associated antigen B5-like [Chinchilla lanigera]
MAEICLNFHLWDLRNVRCLQHQPSYSRSPLSFIKSIIMPHHRQKSKTHARKKRPRVCGDNQGCESAQETATAASSSPPPPVLQSGTASYEGQYEERENPFQALKQLFTRAETLHITLWRHKCAFADIFKRACEHLKNVFAVEVREVESTHHSYNLISVLNLPSNGRVQPGSGYPKSGLLMNVLAIIFITGNCAAEEDIWRFLKKIHIYPGRKHLVFGEPKKLFTQDLVRLNYLQYWQVPGSHPAHHEFLWGPKACANTTQKKVLKFLSKINKAFPAYFSWLYEIAVRDEGQKALIAGAGKPGSVAKPVAVSTHSAALSCLLMCEAFDHLLKERGYHYREFS